MAIPPQTAIKPLIDLAEAQPDPSVDRNMLLSGLVAAASRAIGQAAARRAAAVAHALMIELKDRDPDFLERLGVLPIKSRGAPLLGPRERRVAQLARLADLDYLDAYRRVFEPTWFSRVRNRLAPAAERLARLRATPSTWRPALAREAAIARYAAGAPVPTTTLRPLPRVPGRKPGRFWRLFGRAAAEWL